MIGYYVHHQGAGHLRRMESITAHSHQDVTVLSSLPRPASYRGGWVHLAPDDQDPFPRDVTAGGTLHWAPRHDPGLARRSAQILAWLADARPALVVVDVSVEVALLVRLAGVPVVVAAMRGDRCDRPHATAYDLADVLVAPWPEESPEPWPRHWLDKTVHLGGLSRFDGWTRPASPADRRAAPARCCCGARAVPGRTRPSSRGCGPRRRPGSGSSPTRVGGSGPRRSGGRSAAPTWW